MSQLLSEFPECSSIVAFPVVFRQVGYAKCDVARRLECKPHTGGDIVRGQASHRQFIDIGGRVGVVRVHEQIVEAALRPSRVIGLRRTEDHIVVLRLKLTGPTGRWLYLFQLQIFESGFECVNIVVVVRALARANFEVVYCKHMKGLTLAGIVSDIDVEC